MTMVWVDEPSCHVSWQFFKYSLDCPLSSASQDHVAYLSSSGDGRGVDDRAAIKLGVGMAPTDTASVEAVAKGWGYPKTKVADMLLL